MPKIQDPVWKKFNLPELRERPAYRFGYNTTYRRPNDLSDKDKAAWQLGRDEAQLTRNFNLRLGR